MSGRLIFCAALLAINVTANAAQTAQQACAVLMAVVQPNAEPYDWLAADNAVMQGLSVDFLQALAQKTQLGIKKVPAENAEKALREVRSGRVDLIIGVHSEPEKDQRLDYLYPAYVKQDYRIWVRTGEQASLKQWPQLSGLRGVRALASKQLPDFDIQAQLLAWPMQGVQDDKTATQMVLEGHADYLIAEQNQQQLRLQQAHQLELFEAIEPPVASRELYLALSKDSACNDEVLRNKLSKALLELTQSGAGKKHLNDAMQRWQAQHSSDSSTKSE